MDNDNTVKRERRSLQLSPSRLRPHLVEATVRVHEYPDGQLAVFWGPHRLADYTADGSIIQPEVCAIPLITSGRKGGTAMPRRRNAGSCQAAQPEPPPVDMWTT